MAQGRSGAMGLVALVLVVFGLLELSTATTYTVGDSGGWIFGVSDWPNGKNFLAGDVLVFQYSAVHHNVVAVNADGYNSCSVPPGSTTYTSGNDSITLQKGANFFLCGFPGHCSGGMKIQANAA
ncbi:hypothetical protein AMTRI_Chr04g251240 [Amborella trichopoda]|uniref:Plantacyanin n=1 Tax=Amborella trichopoda TaxID=13333 RepID=W1NEA6_AMBTC|nr:basic blue protein [Amborella trichopoda]ERM94117.1 hypothetical protein AMTR_s00010p00134400 [Amborella trichopoda]|eukprot:XP_006826880.1 basic blue protein [Amborella trichopoda]